MGSMQMLPFSFYSVTLLNRFLGLITGRTTITVRAGGMIAPANGLPKSIGSFIEAFQSMENLNKYF
jgi:hypothetical protein